MATISVIIPCYNAGDYIEKTLRALEQQTFQDFEVIAVDDCSSDNTAEVIRTIAAGSKLRLALLQNEVNSGPALSRNRGIAASSAEFVCFCDSDDWYEEDYLQLMYEKSQEENADIVIADYYTVSSQGQKNEKVLGIQKTLSAAEALAINVDSMCIMLCRRSLFDGLELPNLRNGEDMAVIPALLSRANRIAFVEKCLYNYLYRESSASNRANDKVVDSIILSFQHVERTVSAEYQEEIEYIGVRNLIYGALLNYFKYAKNNKRADEILDVFSEKYPNWYQNQYLNQMPTYKRIFVKAAHGRFYFVLRLLAKLHTKLAG